MTRFTVNSAGVAEDINPTVVDFLGQRYGIGDHVVYATTSTRSPVQKYAEVVSIIHEVRERYGRWVADADGNGGARRVAEPYLYPKIGVRQISNGRGFGFSNHKYVKDGAGSWTAVPCETRVSYPTPENIVKVRTRD